MMAKMMIRIIINCGRCDNIRESVDGTGGHMMWSCKILDMQTLPHIMLKDCPLEDCEEVEEQ